MTESMPRELPMAKQKRTNPVILQPGMIIGANAAEMDNEFLLKCFVHYPPVDLCMNVASRGMVVDGRTGSGKTAILKYIHSRSEHSVEIDPSEMAMSYVSKLGRAQLPARYRRRPGLVVPSSLEARPLHRIHSPEIFSYERNVVPFRL
jgi:Cdc6-like AAA superfamily ATPase